MDPPDLPERVADRYVRVAPLGRGGMGSVWRVHDTRLGRDLALKVVRADLARPDELARFEEEARVSAALQHPGIVPVHDLGVLPDGRLWFTMQEVHGDTLDARLTAAHRAWRLGREGSGEGTVRRLLDAMLRVCEAVGYAHARGVVHRDLKPANLMLGEHGEVFVLDWGLAKLRGGLPLGDRVVPAGAGTRLGAIAGTPAYLSPEQAQGRSSEVTARSDVYALGATLYDVLCERPPRVALAEDRLIAAIAAATPIEPPSRRAPLPLVDEGLDAVVLRALSADPGARHADARALARDLADWLDGARNRDRAEVLLAEADARLADAERAALEADRHRDTARSLLASLPVHAPPADKRAGWDHEDRAHKQAAAARAARTGAMQALRAALSLVPDWRPAHARLADLLRATHATLEAARRPDDAEAVAADLAVHDHDGRHAAYLTGTGAVTLRTDVPVEVHLHRFVEADRRLQPVFERVLGTTPVHAAPLPMGSWLLTFHRGGYEVVRYPVAIGRGEHWHGCAPDEQEPRVVHVPRLGALGPDERYVPAGWVWVGDDEYEHTLPLARVWAEGFVIGRAPVTVGAYVDYLNALLDAGDVDVARAAEPLLGDADEPLFARGADGRFLGIRDDRRGPGWDALPRGPDTPAVSIDWAQARAYCAWRARDGVPWRLPMEREWQKAARGADRRRYPWGDHLEPAWCRMVWSAPETMIVPVDAYPLDVSVYGVSGLAGNVADWVADGTTDPPGPVDPRRVYVGEWESPQRLVCGGTCGSGPRTCETAQRSRFSPASRAIRVGFRLARTLGETTDAAGR